MNIGGGSLKQMMDTIRLNRELLGKKKSPRELYKEEIKRLGTTYENQDLELVRERVEKTLKRNKTHEAIARICAFSFLTCLIVAGIWTHTTVDFSIKSPNKYEDTSTLFKTKTESQEDSLTLKTDYFPQGPKAAETFYKDGLRHTQSISYYESGQLFHSAFYYYDTLITETYLFKSGDTIKNFPMITGTRVHTIDLVDSANSKRITFDLFDGKIVQGTYLEAKVESKGQ